MRRSLCFALAALGAGACRGSKHGDTTRPSITIISPTTATSYSKIGAPDLVIGGAASDDVGIASVRWSNALTGGEGTAVTTTSGGAASWAASIPMAIGSNNAITITAVDAAGNIGTDAITVHTASVVEVWGRNASGELGNGTTVSSPVPLSLTGLSTVVAVATSNAFGGVEGNHTLALLADGTVRAWGSNTYGELGDGTTTPALSPVMVGLTNVTAIAAGDTHSVALLADGTVRTWGLDLVGNSPLPVEVPGLSGVVAISAGDQWTLALLADGTLRAWGNNSSGQLGDGTTVASTTPVIVTGIASVVAISSGSSFAMALLSDGTVETWGQNSQGQLGNGSTTDSSVPVVVSGLSGAVAIDAGTFYGLAVLADGTMRGWGDDTNGQLGDGGTSSTSLTPVAAAGLSNVISPTAGFQHSSVLLSDGSIRTWGDNTDGDLGDGGGFASHTPVDVGLAGVVGIAAGYSYSIAVRIP